MQNQPIKTIDSLLIYLFFIATVARRARRTRINKLSEEEYNYVMNLAAQNQLTSTIQV